MNKPVVIERFADNGEHSHWVLCESETGKYLWSEFPEEEFPANQEELAHLSELKRGEGEIRIGEYLLKKHEPITNQINVLWIANKSGEGMSINLDKLWKDIF